MCILCSAMYWHRGIYTVGAIDLICKLAVHVDTSNNLDYLRTKQENVLVGETIGALSPAAAAASEGGGLETRPPG